MPVPDTYPAALGPMQQSPIPTNPADLAKLIPSKAAAVGRQAPASPPGMMTQSAEFQANLKLLADSHTAAQQAASQAEELAQSQRKAALARQADIVAAQ